MTKGKKGYGAFDFWKSVDGASAFLSYGDLTAEDLLKEYRRNNIVHSAANKNANALAESAYNGLKVWKDGADGEPEQVPDHPIVKLLETVNDTLNGYDLWHLTSRYLDVLGRCYWLITVAVGVPVAIDILPPQHVKQLSDDKGYTVAYGYKAKKNSDPKFFAKRLDDAGGPVGDITTEENQFVVEFLLSSLDNPYCGADSPLVAAIEEVRTSTAYTEYQKNLIKNKVRPDYIVSPKSEDYDPNEMDRLEVDFEQKVGRKNSGKPYFAKTPLNVVPLGFPPSDLASLQIQEAVIKAVCNAFSQPPALYDKDANYANMEASKALWAEQFVAPRQFKIELDLNAQLMPLYGDEAYICFDSPIPEDQEQARKNKETEDKNTALLVQSEAITKDELRAKAGLPPLEDGSGGEVVKAPQPSAAPAPVREQPQEKAAVLAVADPQPLDLDGLLKINEAVAAGRLDTATAINLAAATLSLSDDMAKRLIVKRSPAPKAEKVNRPSDFKGDWKRLAAVLKRTFAEQRAQVMGRIDKALKGGADLDPIRNALGVKALPDVHVPLDEWNDELDKRVRPVVELFANEGATGTLTRVGASPDVFAVVPAKVKESVARASLRFAESINATTAKKIEDAVSDLRQELEDGLLEGDSVTELRKRVQSVFDNAETDRAELIAQTEAQRAVHTGQRIAAIESGVVKGFKFLASSDACLTCLEHEAKEIDLDGSFFDDDHGDGLIPVHPGCRCTMLEVLKDE